MGRAEHRTALAAGCGVALASVVAACGGSSSSDRRARVPPPAAASTAGGAASTAASAAGGKVGVILPDTKSSIRWESFDRPLLEEAFKAAGVEYDIQNAEGDKNKMATIADQMITSGVKVLMIVNLDSESGAAIQQKAADAGVQTIDYDRLTLGGSAGLTCRSTTSRSATLQGEGLVKCITDKGVEKPAIAVLNGSPTDNNATLFKQGYDSVLEPKFDSGEWTKVDDQSVPDWDNQKGGQIFEQMLTKADGKIDGVLAANDGLGQRGHRGQQEEQPADPGHRSGRDARGAAEHPRRRPVHDGLQGGQEGGRRLPPTPPIALLKGEKPDTTGTARRHRGQPGRARPSCSTPVRSPRTT